MKDGDKRVGWDWYLSPLERMEPKDFKRHYDVLESIGDFVVRRFGFNASHCKLLFFESRFPHP